MLARPVRLGASAAVLALLPTLGCSWLIHTPPKGPIQPSPPLECESSRAAPAADTVGALLFGVGGLVALASTPPSCSGGTMSGICDAGRVMVVGGGVLALCTGAVFAFSAGHGYSVTAECRSLKQAQLSCTSGVEEACRSLQERKP